MSASAFAPVPAAPAAPPTAAAAAAATVAADAEAGRFIIAFSRSGANCPIWPSQSIWLKAAVVAASMSPASPEASSELIIGFCFAACAVSVCFSVSSGLGGVGVAAAACAFLPTAAIDGTGVVGGGVATAAAAAAAAVASSVVFDLSFTSSSCVCRIVSSCCSEITSMSGSCSMLGKANASGSRSSGRVVSSRGISRAGDASTAFSRSFGTSSGSGTFQAGLPTSRRSWVSGSGSLPEAAAAAAAAALCWLEGVTEAVAAPLLPPAAIALISEAALTPALDVVTAGTVLPAPPVGLCCCCCCCCSGSVLMRFAFGSLVSSAALALPPPPLDDESRFASSEQLTVGLADLRHLPRSSGSFCCTVPPVLEVVVVATAALPLVLVATVLVVVVAETPTPSAAAGRPPPFATAATAAAACDISASITLDVVELLLELDAEMDFGCRNRSGDGGTAGSPLGCGDCIASELCDTGRGEGDRLRLRQLRSFGSSSWHESGDITIGASAGSSFAEVLTEADDSLLPPPLSPPLRSPSAASFPAALLASAAAALAKSFIVMDSSSSSVVVEEDAADEVVVVVDAVVVALPPPPIVTVLDCCCCCVIAPDAATVCSGANGFGSRSSSTPPSLPPPLALPPPTPPPTPPPNRSPVRPSISPASLNDKHFGEVLSDSPSREMMSATGSGSSSTSSSSSSL
uniref:Uncharacterized protein n=1 Tax=Anopheles merus TaxID=30066 RepID=A0A182V9N3_ANOME